MTDAPGSGRRDRRTRLDHAAGDRQQPPRIWWVPTGPLTMLPLHAAGHHAGDRAGDRADTLLDRVVSSYLPTIGARHRTRSTGPATAARAPVDQPATPGLAPLPFAAQDARRVRQRLPHGLDLSGPAATADAVLAGHAMAHLSCCGTLYLHDRPLTVAEIAGHRFPGGQLAYLPACGTSTGGVRVLDEAMHLSAAFQVAGFQHVIATLWTINDDRSVPVADDVYAALTADGAPDAAKTAGALHGAVARLRAQYPHAPLLWAPYVHSGP
jgi:CHAT domain-containing protein